MSVTDWIITYTGRKFYPLAPRAADIDIVDIAHALGNQCRYAGHTRKFYSVAEHSVRLTRSLKREGESREVLRHALLHDASEAYLTDVVRPLKKEPTFDFYREAEERVQNLIQEVYGLSAGIPPVVLAADTEIVHDEAVALLLPHLHPEWKLPKPRNIEIGGWAPAMAEEIFLEEFRKLWRP